jgi:hypothetical protein
MVATVELDVELEWSKLIAAFKGEHRAAINRKMKKPLTALAVAGHIYFLLLRCGWTIRTSLRLPQPVMRQGIAQPLLIF